MSAEREPTPRATPRRHAAHTAVRVVFARLRFVLVLGLSGLVIGNWDRHRSTWDRLTSAARTEEPVSSDTEYFCPMDPGVLSDWPAKCPVCSMTLVRRKKGEMAPVPDGTVARMQFSPARLWLGGIQTVPAAYAPLVRTIDLPGHVVNATNPCEIEAEAFASDLPWLAVAQEAAVRTLDGPAGSDAGKAAITRIESAEHPSFRTVRLRLGTVAGHALEVGTQVLVHIDAAAERLEPFCSQPSEPPPLRPAEPRRLFACMDHPEVISLTAGRCPRDQTELMARPLADNQRVQWWCPMHPTVVAPEPGATCAECGGMPLVPRLVSYRRPGTVLSVPVAAVIADGRRSVVYLDRGGGLFEGRLVTLGPRCGAAYPVISGLEPGDRVVAQGAFLLDAETQLNPALAGAYFGAGPRPEPVPAQPATTSSSNRASPGLDGLSAADRVLAERQRICPVTGKPLGSMGLPPRVELEGRVVFVCCSGCTSALQADPGTYLSRIGGPTAEPPP